MKKIILIFAAIFLLILFAANLDHSFVAVLIFIGFIYLMIKGVRTIFGRRKRPIKQNELPPISKERNEHYEALGLNEQEIVFFRETMNTAKKQIKQLERNMHAVSKLKAIDLRVNTVKTAKALFKRLADEPNKLHLADQFLYHHLPNILELSDKFIEINQHDVKTKNSYTALEKSAQMIEQVSNLLIEDYQHFVADDISELAIELSIAKQNLERQQQHNTIKSEKQVSHDTIDSTDDDTSLTSNDKSKLD